MGSTINCITLFFSLPSVSSSASLQIINEIPAYLLKAFKVQAGLCFDLLTNSLPQQKERCSTLNGGYVHSLRGTIPRDIPQYFSQQIQRLLHFDILLSHLNWTVSDKELLNFKLIMQNSVKL